MNDREELSDADRADGAEDDRDNPLRSPALRMRPPNRPNRPTKETETENEAEAAEEQ